MCLFFSDHLEGFAARDEVVEEQMQCGRPNGARTVGDEGAPSALDLEQTIRTQDFERFAHRDAADTELVGKFLLGPDRVAGVERAPEDAGLNDVGNLKVQRHGR